MKIGIVDYNAGNLTSVVSAFSHLGADYIVSYDREELLACDKLVFPGVGEAYSAMEHISERNLKETLKLFVATGKPFLGICLGCQIILDFSEERDVDCLGLVSGRCVRFPGDMGLKIPHIGWNTLRHSDEGVFKGIPQDSSFYFVHSYYIKPADEKNIAGTTEYGIKFCSAVNYENITAVQFHPEKSGEVGLQLLQNFIDL